MENPVKVEVFYNNDFAFAEIKYKGQKLALDGEEMCHIADLQCDCWYQVDLPEEFEGRTRYDVNIYEDDETGEWKAEMSPVKVDNLGYNTTDTAISYTVEVEEA
jgi:hypothetical protein